jgi:hypothetical protein
LGECRQAGRSEREAGRERSGAGNNAPGGARLSEQARHAMGQGAAGRGQRGADARRGGDPEERAGVCGRVAGDRHGDVVAAQLAFGVDVSRDPPDGWVVEEQRFNHGLGEVHEIVVAADMRQLVEEEGLEVRGGEAGEGARGHEHQGPEPADYGRRFDEGRDQQANGSRDGDAGLQPVERLLPFGGRGSNGLRAEPRGNQTASEQPHPERPGSREPDADHPGEERAGETRGEVHGVRKDGERRARRAGRRQGGGEGCGYGLGELGRRCDPGCNSGSEHRGQRAAGDRIPRGRSSARKPPRGRIDRGDRESLP